jgi:hypothetical protein
MSKFRFVLARDPLTQNENSGRVWESEEAGFAGSNELSDSETNNTAPKVKKPALPVRTS